MLSSSWSRQQHEKTTHTGEQHFRCHCCERAFSTAYRLKRHMSAHTTERPHRCECGASFTLLTSYQRHMRGHMDDRPHACTQCDKRFIEPYKLKKHMLVHLKNQ